MGEDGKVVYKVIIDDSGVVDEAEKAGEKSAGALEQSANKGAKKYEEMDDHELMLEMQSGLLDIEARYSAISSTKNVIKNFFDIC